MSRSSNGVPLTVLTEIRLSLHVWPVRKGPWVKGFVVTLTWTRYVIQCCVSLHTAFTCVPKQHHKYLPKVFLMSILILFGLKYKEDQMPGKRVNIDPLLPPRDWIFSSNKQIKSGEFRYDFIAGGTSPAAVWRKQEWIESSVMEWGLEGPFRLWPYCNTLRNITGTECCGPTKDLFI